MCGDGCKCDRCRKRTWRLANPERARKADAQRNRERSERDPEFWKRVRKSWTDEQKRRHRERVAEWVAEHPEYRARLYAEYHARRVLRGLPSDIHEMRLTLLEFRRRCGPQSRFL